MTLVEAVMVLQLMIVLHVKMVPSHSLPQQADVNRLVQMDFMAMSEAMNVNLVIQHVLNAQDQEAANVNHAILVTCSIRQLVQAHAQLQSQLK
eukprot:CAMPEP_0114603068 /NCGR_PEP_ID=MMETSP0125-20121206/25544_1 /TAXON_ID=485358 ORGANISM="Aristerostoma sp., Strain ATCC 50986" /NCGR_SAMPLE_ID=MMETSP0125 /ASSEMBLY_ACC=CAM_ASM_000245 /LENGTH=92 /DNA_ID=CAMNT_0001813641 /DNA_START=951 /DNA_END=1229 /DNA_ORIENTATION=-